LARRVALVTGAGTGIGRAAALALLVDGYSVALVGRRRELLEETAALAGARGRMLVLPADVTNAEAVADVFESLRSTWGRLDVLFNNAGRRAPSVPLEELSPADWQAVVEVNVTAVFLCTQQAIRIMKEQDPPGGRIINNGSVAAHAPRPYSAAYTATKHAVTGLTKATSLDGRRHNIACAQLDLGNTRTAMGSDADRGLLQPDGRVVSEPAMDVDHVGRTVAYMSGLPLDVNIQSMILIPTTMPFVGRG
jgi:NAD(P)-dependent dehydrogenase (short-subunit alcohol dehydrogenase family)